MKKRWPKKLAGRACLGKLRRGATLRNYAAGYGPRRRICTGPPNLRMRSGEQRDALPMQKRLQSTDDLSRPNDSDVGSTKEFKGGRNAEEK